MSRFIPAAGAASYRHPLTVDNSGAAATVDISFDLSTIDEPEFWDRIQNANGYDIYAVHSNGKTLLDYDITGFNRTTKVGTLRIDAAPLQAVAGVYQIWIYWGNASATSQFDASITITSAVNAYWDARRPGPEILKFRPQAPRAAVPRLRVTKATSEERYLWLDVSDFLAKRRSPYGGGYQFEEILGAVLDVQLATVSQAGMFDATAQRFVELEGRSYVGCLLKGGTTATQYTGIIKVWTCVGSSGKLQTIEERFYIFVKNVSEA